jgi:hypothetical protein
VKPSFPGNIIVRQRGTRWYPGAGTGIGKDHTIFATEEGRVTFSKGFKGRTFISVLPAAGGRRVTPYPNWIFHEGPAISPALSHFLTLLLCRHGRACPPRGRTRTRRTDKRQGSGRRRTEPMKQETIVTQQVIEAPRMILRPMRGVGRGVDDALCVRQARGGDDGNDDSAPAIPPAPWRPMSRKPCAGRHR